MENETPPDSEKEVKRQAKREKNRARAAAYRKANAEKRNANARARRAALSTLNAWPSARSKRRATENREKYLESVRRSNAKRPTKKPV
jgi:hypothetical protein